MILFDPGLVPRSAQSPASARHSAVAQARKDSIDRLPSGQTLARFLAAAQRAVRLPAHVSVLLTTDAEIRRLNRRFRGIDKPTDVLSFPAAETPSAVERIAGDLAISFPTARRQAGEHGHSVLIEIKVLILHGLLHLAGYDHHTDSGEMERRERLLRERLKLPHGLIERAGRDSARSRINRNKPVKAVASRARKGRKL